MNIWKISSQGAHRHNGWPFNKFSGLWLALGRASLFQAFSIGQTIPSSFWECGSNPTFMQANEFLEWLSTEYSVHSYFCGLDGSIRLFSFECFFFNFIFDYWVHSLHFHLMWKFYSVFVEKNCTYSEILIGIGVLLGPLWKFTIIHDGIGWRKIGC